MSATSRARDSVLVIDDDRYLRDLVAMTCELEGLPCLEAPDCASAIELLKREKDRVRLILLDYYMPGMTPPKCNEGLKAISGAEIPIVLITAADDASARAAELGLARWMAKPFDLAQLVDLLKG